MKQSLRQMIHTGIYTTCAAGRMLRRKRIHEGFVLDPHVRWVSRCPHSLPTISIWGFPKIGVPYGVPYSGVLIIRILLFRVLY